VEYIFILAKIMNYARDFIFLKHVKQEALKIKNEKYK
jgi:hypothetical protein